MWYCQMMTIPPFKYLIDRIFNPVYCRFRYKEQLMWLNMKGRVVVIQPSNYQLDSNPIQPVRSSVRLSCRSTSTPLWNHSNMFHRAHQHMPAFPDTTAAACRLVVWLSACAAAVGAEVTDIICSNHTPCPAIEQGMGTRLYKIARVVIIL